MFCNTHYEVLLTLEMFVYSWCYHWSILPHPHFLFSNQENISSALFLKQVYNCLQNMSEDSHPSREPQSSRRKPSMQKIRMAWATALISTALYGSHRPTHAFLATQHSQAEHHSTTGFEPEGESRVIIDTMQHLYGTRVTLESHWDSRRERLALEPASLEALHIISEGFSDMWELDTMLQNSRYGTPRRSSILPAELRIFSLKGLDGTPGGGYANNSIRLIIPGSVRYEAPARADKDGIQRKETDKDVLKHTIEHEIAHRLGELYPEIYTEYTSRFWRQQRDGTWRLTTSNHATGYYGEPHPAEFFADIVALSHSKYGSKTLDAQSRIFVLSNPILRVWHHGDVDRDKGIQTIFAPISTR